jgi:hypothetical protein
MKHAARDYLQPLLHDGESSEELERTFGPPIAEYETQNKELSLTYAFSDHNQPAAARAVGVGGVTAFLVSNRLTHWDPVYETRNPAVESSSIKHSPVAFSSDHAVLAFHVASEEKREGSVYVDNSAFEKLGYIGKAPDLSVQSGQYIVYDSAHTSMHTIELVLSRGDGEKLKVLTSENIGKRLALLVASNVVLAPYVSEPISDGQMMIELPDPAYQTLIKALQAATVH